MQGGHEPPATFLRHESTIMKVAILAYPQAVPTSVIGPYDILAKSGHVFKQLFPINSGDKFDITLVGHPTETLISHPLMPIEEAISTRQQFDLVVIPAIEPLKIAEVLEQGTAMQDFIKTQYTGGAELASICMGAFLLASTGLLDGKRATTHWMGVDHFRQMFPEVILEDDKVIVDEGRIYSCGGAFTFTALMMYLVEKYCGHETAVMASKILLIDLYKDPQSSYQIFSLQHQHDDEVIREAQHRIEKEFTENISVTSLSENACMSTRTFLRRFKRATGNTPLEYLQRVRIEAAKKALENDTSAVDEIPSQVGYEDYGSFLKLFKRYTGVTPTDYRRKYKRPSVRENMVV